MESPETSPDPASGPRRGSLLVIFLTVFVDLLGFGMVLPLLPIYGEHFAVERGWSDAVVGITVGLLLSCFSLMQFLFLPIWGRLSDHYGRRPVLLIGLAGSTAFYTLFGVATAWRSLWGLFVARIGAGIAGATISTAQAYIADSTPREGRAKGMALIGAAFALSFTIGPLLGAVSLLTGESAAYSPWPGYFAGILSAAAFGLAWFLLPESLLHEEHRERKWFDFAALRQALGTPSILLLLLSSFITVLSFTNFEATLSLQIKNIFSAVTGDSAQETPRLLQSLISQAARLGLEKPAEAQLYVVFVTFAYLGIVLTLAQGFLVRRLAGRLSESIMAGAGAVFSIIGFVLLSRAVAVSGYGFIIVAMAVEVIGFAFITPSLQSLISRRSDPKRQGQILGLAQSLSSLARILGPFFGLWLLAYNPTLPYWLAAGVMMAGFVLILCAARAGRDWGTE